MDLQDYRDEIDKIDERMATLFVERMRICAKTAEYKANAGIPIYDAKRIEQKMKNADTLTDDEHDQAAVRELITQMMAIGRRYQYRRQAELGQSELSNFGFTPLETLPQRGPVVYQGVEGAYGNAAALQYFGLEVAIYHVETFEEAMKEVQDGRAAYAVLPIENSSAGSVVDNYDLLPRYQNYIVAETFLPVSHCLLARPEAELSDIRTVYSHPQALMQCSRFLNAQKEWRQVSLANTAIAARKVIEEEDKSQAAVASEIAGQLYGLKTLKSSIQNNQGNTTRFIILSRHAIYRTDASKVSITFELPHRSGTLYNILSHFIFNGVSMQMIESRPIQGRNWEYRFFVDIEGNLQDIAVKNALTGIANEAQNMRILGNY
ncbi:MAG: prephenate dehydratase [Clostridiales bacterium]|nr:prephenate dehydratase [Clostridiales bacterium]